MIGCNAKNVCKNIGNNFDLFRRRKIYQEMPRMKDDDGARRA